jgi:hypothetical protein
MKRSSQPRRTLSNFSAPVHQRLSAYALAAGATGVSLLALAQPSEAEIVYTPDNQTIGHNSSYKLDLNHDGITDFTISERAFEDGVIPAQSLLVKSPPDNKINCPGQYCLSTWVYAAALGPGSEIDTTQRQHGWLAGRAQMAFQATTNQGLFLYGPWNNVKNGYLGLKFQINGEVHLGWARLNVTYSVKDGSWEAHLTGYAYETIPGKSIKAGQTTEDDDSAESRKPASSPAQFATLGALALGNAGLALWRREEPAIK